MKLQKSQGGVRGGGRRASRVTGVNPGSRVQTNRWAWESSRVEEGQETFQRLVSVQETERRRLARELHDEIGQALTVIQLNLQAVLGAGKSVPSEEVRLAESLAVVDRVLEQVRDISLELRPSMLDELGLEPALRWYISRQASASGVRVRFDMDAIEGRLDSGLETECFRIVQEALTNVVRHAQAREVAVEIRVQNERLHLTIADDGVGFDVAAERGRAVRGSSLGLLSMEERAAMAGGHLAVHSVPGMGSRILACLPVKRAVVEPGPFQ